MSPIESAKRINQSIASELNVIVLLRTMVKQGIIKYLWHTKVHSSIGRARAPTRYTGLIKTVVNDPIQQRTRMAEDRNT